MGDLRDQFSNWGFRPYWLKARGGRSRLWNSFSDSGGLSVYVTVLPMIAEKRGASSISPYSCDSGDLASPKLFIRDYQLFKFAQ